MLFSILLERIAIMALLMAVGVYLSRKGFLSEQGSRDLGAILLRIIIPCVIIKSYITEYSHQRLLELGLSALLALMENLQRRDLDCWEEAAAIARLISRYGLSQEEAARRLGRAQPTVANKLRLLRLPEDVRNLLRENGLTERHARALLRLQDPEIQRRAAGDMVRRQMNVAQAEAHVEKLLQEDRTTPPRGRSTYIIKDVRLFLNSVDRGLHLMRQAGVDAGWDRRDTEQEILLTIRIPKRART